MVKNDPFRRLPGDIENPPASSASGSDPSCRTFVAKCAAFNVRIDAGLESAIAN
jgi:hypothetical protein